MGFDFQLMILLNMDQLELNSAQELEKNVFIKKKNNKNEIEKITTFFLYKRIC